MQLHGSICALVTPFDAREQLDFLALDRLLDWHLASGTHGLVLAGSTGEAALLDDDEYRVLIAHAVQRVSVFSAGIVVQSSRQDLAAEFIRFLLSERARPVIVTTGLEPVHQ